MTHNKASLRYDSPHNIEKIRFCRGILYRIGSITRGWGLSLGDYPTWQLQRCKTLRTPFYCKALADLCEGQQVIVHFVTICKLHTCSLFIYVLGLRLQNGGPLLYWLDVLHDRERNSGPDGRI